jgi:EmrB/QacA subfamily drug resistance transporter
VTSSPPRAVAPFVVLATVLPAVFMQLVDISIVNVGIPSIQRELGASYAQIQLILTGYQLAFACVLITAARLGDILGRRRVYLVGMAGFTATSVLCAAAPTPEVLIVGRILQGLTSGAMFPQVISIIQVTFPPAERGKAFGIYGATIGLAAITGPMLGGVLLALDPGGLGWRSLFYVNVPIGIAATIAAAGNLPESRAPEGRRLDLPGAALATVGLFCLVFPLTEGRERGWPSWVFAMLAASVVALVWFAVMQRRKTGAGGSPLVYTTLFRNLSFRRGLAFAALFSSSIPSFFFILTLYLQIGLDFSALHAGLTTLPFSIGSMLSSLGSNRLVQRFGGRVLQAGCACFLVAFILIWVVVGLVGVDLSSFHLTAVVLLAGLGLGFTMAPMTNIILASIEGREVGSASGVLSTCQQVGGALGVTAIGILFFTILPVHADRALERVVPALDQRLVAAGLSPTAATGVSTRFAACFAARARAPDPGAHPPECEPVAGAAAPRAGDPVDQAVGHFALPVALGQSFAGAFRVALFYPIACLALCLLISFSLPRSPGRSGPEGAGPGTGGEA